MGSSASLKLIRSFPGSRKNPAVETTGITRWNQKLEPEYSLEKPKIGRKNSATVRKVVSTITVPTKRKRKAPRDVAGPSFFLRTRPETRHHRDAVPATMLESTV